MKIVLAMVGMLGLALTCSDNNLFPILNLLGLALLFTACKKLRHHLESEEKAQPSAFPQRAVPTLSLPPIGRKPFCNGLCPIRRQS